MTFPPATLELQVNTCGTVRCEPSWSWSPDPKIFVDYDLWFVWSGTGTMEMNGRPIPVHPGTLLLLHPHGTYRGTHNPQSPLGVTYIHFQAVKPRGRPQRFQPKELPPTTSSSTTSPSTTSPSAASSASPATTN